MRILHLNSDDVLDREKVIVALEQKRSQFENYAGDLRRQRDAVRTRLAAIQEYDYAALCNYINATEVASPGALPTREWDKTDTLCFSLGQSWASHEHARAWARDVLTGRPVAAVDGSQIVPSKDYNLPVGAVQVGWFINPHEAGTPYIKDVTFQVFGPDELAADEENEGDDRAMPNWRVNQERFVRECEQLCTIMASYASAPQRVKPLCFFDGSLIISFVGPMRAEQAAPYIGAVNKLLDCSAETRVPLVAFVDRSYSRDFVKLVDLVSSIGSGNELTLSDAALFEPLLPNWGDRSPLFYCARADKLSQAGRVPFYTDVAFTYVRLTRDRVPARVEMPRWIVEENLADDVLDLVRAECVVGAGYPYAAETADALAVISHADRERFYNLFEQFARKSELELVQARKAASKVARR